MKAETLNRYAQRIDRAIELLTEKLNHGSVPALEDLADAAALSKFHFHRIFRLMTGETVNEAVRRIRLAKGSATIEQSTITNASAEAAYATSQGYARAMRGFTGMSASQAVRQADLQQLFAPRDASAPLKIELIELQPLQVLAIRNKADFADLDALFSRLFDIAGGPEAVKGIFGVYLQDPRFADGDGCDFEAAIEIASTPDQFGEARLKEIGGGKFLSLHHAGDYDSIPLALDELTFAVMRDPTLEFRDAAPLVHYLDDPEETDPDLLRSDIHLPVRAGA